MSDLNKVAIGSITIDTDQGYKDVANLNQSLLTRIKNILANMGLYTFDANDAAHALVKTLRSPNLTNEYTQLSVEEKDLVISVIGSVAKRATGSERIELKIASRKLFELYENDQINTQIASDRQFVHELQNAKRVSDDCFEIGDEEDDTFADSRVIKETVPATQNSEMVETRKANALALHNELIKLSDDKLKSDLDFIFLMYNETPHTHMESMIDKLVKHNQSELLNRILLGSNITKEELLIGEKSLADALK